MLSKNMISKNILDFKMIMSLALFLEVYLVIALFEHGNIYGVFEQKIVECDLY